MSGKRHDGWRFTKELRVNRYLRNSASARLEVRCSILLSYRRVRHLRYTNGLMRDLLTNFSAGSAAAAAGRAASSGRRRAEVLGRPRGGVRVVLLSPSRTRAGPEGERDETV